jgi:hypothetical protein
MVVICVSSLERSFCVYISVYVDSDAVMHRASKASCWHAGVLLAAPTVKPGGVNDPVTQFKI